ncbi:unnamed protein product [Lactuca virosa]|uniref:phosphoribosylaminoimidazole carboxylase n=1 Tax=Lactuca virosa TaxID=75947 RepID=A0AAU9MQY5_9ASTR|nr:unnamed protein product [Lactuca virosa]
MEYDQGQKMNMMLNGIRWFSKELGKLDFNMEFNTNEGEDNTTGERGIQVIIAGAGGAAHLPGMVAAEASQLLLLVQGCSPFTRYGSCIDTLTCHWSSCACFSIRWP